MFEKPDFNSNGEKILCEMNGKNAEMHMNIRIKRLEKSGTFTLFDEKNETAFLILRGDIQIFWNGEERNMHRASPFVKKPFCLHVPKNTQVSVQANMTSEILIQQTDNERKFEPVFYTPDMVLYQEFGKGQWDEAGRRICSTVFDYDNAPYSNIDRKSVV